MEKTAKWLWLQLFGEGGGEGAGAGDGGAGEAVAATTGDISPDAGEARLRELGVPESVLAKRANRAKARGQQPAAEHAQQTEAPKQEPAQQAAAAEQTNAPTEEEPEQKPSRMSWDEIMADPEYNKQMQSVIRARLKAQGDAEEKLSKLAPALELLARSHGLDPKNMDYDALTKAISDDDSFYEDKALEMGVSVETAKRLDQNERELARRQEEERRTAEQQRIAEHIERLKAQGEELKKTFPSFDLAAELRNPTFVRMTSPSGGVSVEDAYYAVHRKEIQQASMKVTAEKTAQQMAAAIQSGMSRPVENGTSAQSPSITSFDYAHASKEQREALKRQIREAAARGQKLYPGKL